MLKCLPPFPGLHLSSQTVGSASLHWLQSGIGAWSLVIWPLGNFLRNGGEFIEPWAQFIILFCWWLSLPDGQLLLITLLTIIDRLDQSKNACANNTSHLLPHLPKLLDAKNTTRSTLMFVQSNICKQKQTFFMS